MPKKSQYARHIYEGGKIVLFKCKHPKTQQWLPNYYATIKLEQGVPRKRISCQSSKREDALDFARKELFKRKGLQQVGLSPETKTFKSVSTAFMKKMKRMVDIGATSQENYDKYEYVINKHLLPYFDTRPIGRIDIDDIDGYLDKRSMTLTNKGTKPTHTTLNRESPVLRNILSHAAERGWIAKIPKIQTFKRVINARPAFSEPQWVSFNNFLQNFHNNQSGYRNHNDKWEKHKSIIYYRKCLRDYVQFICYSGLRTGEASLLKFKDINKEYEEDSNTPYYSINVRALEKGGRKTGQRKVVGLVYIKSILERRMKENSFTRPDDYIFQHPEYRRPKHLVGTPIRSFKRSFRKAIEEWSKKDKEHGLTEIDGTTITPYVIRHSFSHLRLLTGEIDLFSLALQLGNSTTIVEQFYSPNQATAFASKLGKLIVKQQKQKDTSS